MGGAGRDADEFNRRTGGFEGMAHVVNPDLKELLGRAARLGATRADIRYQRHDLEVITVENRALRSYASRRLSGAGIRVAVEGAVGYASTSDLTPEGLEGALDSALRAARSFRTSRPVYEEARAEEADLRLPVRVDPADIPPEEKVAVALDANKAAWTLNEVRSATTTLGLSKDLREFASSDGAEVRVETTLVGLGHESVAKVGGVMERCRHSESMCAGFEFIESTDWGAFASGLSELAVEAAASETPPPGTYPVVVDPLVVGLVLHEALGHASEGDLVATGESVLHGRLGERVASGLVTVVDEGVVEGGFYHPFDDEGVRKGRMVVVEDGIMRGYLNDRSSASRSGAGSTGNGRAQDFENLPAVRQTNYYMEAGDQRLEELFDGVDFGIYVKGRGSGGGQVEPGMGAFTFSVGPSKIIRKGEPAETVRGVVISGLILETLKTVDAVGDDPSVRTSVFGGCGKMGQTVKVGDGGPHVRFRAMTVGGR